MPFAVAGTLRADGFRLRRRLRIYGFRLRRRLRIYGFGVIPGPMCFEDRSFSAQMNSNSSVSSITRALVVAVHGSV